MSSTGHSEPEPPERLGKCLLWVLVFAGLLSLVYYYSWWRSPGRMVTPWLAALLGVAAIYSLAQLIASWVLYLSARKRPDPPTPDPALTVDVFITTCGETPQIVDRVLSAACAMRGPHRTWLLDDGDDPRLRELAERAGAGYLTREGREHHKAGNVNAALPRTDGDVVVIRPRRPRSERGRVRRCVARE